VLAAVKALLAAENAAKEAALQAEVAQTTNSIYYVIL
jgi:hypothetical protein